MLYRRAVFANETVSDWQTFTLSTSDEREAYKRKKLLKRKLRSAKIMALKAHAADALYR
jgi:hypothetical protein